MQSIRVRTARRTQMVDVTEEVQRVVTALGVKVGTCYLHVPHTTAAVLINEHADPDVASDAEGALDRLVPSAGPIVTRRGIPTRTSKPCWLALRCLFLWKTGNWRSAAGRASFSRSLTGLGSATFT